MQQWEYSFFRYVVNDSVDERAQEGEVMEALNRRGSEGWELVNCTHTRRGFIGDTALFFAVFKRPK